MIRFVVAHFFALAHVLRSSIELGRAERSSDFDQLVALLREGESFPTWASDPSPYTRLTLRLLRWLPPKGMGPCMKCSLILLDLWSRCGLEPELHLGVRRSGEQLFAAHAWLTAELPGGGRIATSDSGYSASFTLQPDSSLTSEPPA